MKLLLEKIKELHIVSGVFSDELEASMDMPMANWNSWLDPHAPLAGACLFEPQFCEYQRGFEHYFSVACR